MQAVRKGKVFKNVVAFLSRAVIMKIGYCIKDWGGNAIIIGLM